MVNMVFHVHLAWTVLVKTSLCALDDSAHGAMLRKLHLKHFFWKVYKYPVTVYTYYTVTNYAHFSLYDFLRCLLSSFLLSYGKLATHLSSGAEQPIYTVYNCYKTVYLQPPGQDIFCIYKRNTHKPVVLSVLLYSTNGCCRLLM